MNEQTATQLVGVLVTTTTGWNDDAVDATITMMTARWADDHAARDAISHTIETWTNQSRPPWGVLHGAYRDAVRRRMLTAPALESGTPGRIVTFREGRAIAARAYARECESQGRVPTPAVFDSFLGALDNVDK